MTRRAWSSEAFNAASTLLLASALLAGWSTSSAGGQADDTADGRLLFRIHCQSCHGESARGDGPLAELLRIKPPNLRQIAARRKGEFSELEVYQIIDGRTRIQGHGGREMPIWGLSLLERESDAERESEVERRIEILVAYLKSVQEP